MMAPVEHGWEARYYHASRAAHRAWVASQPQYVIPGVLEEVDVARADEEPGCGVHLLESAAAYPPDLPRVAAGSNQTTAPAACLRRTGAAGASRRRF